MTKHVIYKRHRFPPEAITHAVWLYFRFPLSLRLVEEMLLERGILASYETVRRWALKFGSGYARRLKRKIAKVQGFRIPDPLALFIEKQIVAQHSNAKLRFKCPKANLH